MRSQEGSFAVALLLLLLLTAASTAADAEPDVEASVSTLPPGADAPRRMVKRAPTSSFIGMRGKKEEEKDQRAADWIGPDPLDYADMDEESLYFENGRRLKKAPMSFVGMRGKKYIPFSNRLSDVLHQIEEQRMRENLLQDLFERLAAGDDNVGDVGKRAPTGFTGMRGKRPMSGDEDEEDAMELLQKRAPVNSFLGVRGKKDVSHQHYKRAALSEAYDVRGKKERYADFNSKFVAVRGKKSEQDTGLDTDDGDQQYLVRPWLYLWGDNKRAPSGFQGMRGKRPALVE
ncbi:tachykinins isoform X2 [Drosophila guanche]|uniref:Blast:Tachykinins n=1 Tax=Drosophila guanche TaxID=7266 RepID=A0A3B0KFH9_DROGU|nr:tachykinins isoform X2 [Drosophila guanche]SPP84486.1 blast:Tachykinins [Drosophila guanche]